MRQVLVRLTVVAVVVLGATTSGTVPASASVATGMSTAAVPVGGTYTPVVGNFFGNGVGQQPDEILWYRPGPGADYLWSIGANGFLDKTELPIDIDHTYRPYVGDFDNGRRSDILWENPDGADPVWYSQGDGTFQVKTWNIPAGAQILVGDYLRLMSDVFGQDEVFFYRPGSASDGLIVTKADRSAPTTVSFPLSGTYTPLVMQNSNTPPFADAIHWYAPGSAPDYSWEFETCGSSVCKTNTPFTVNGTYTPILDLTPSCTSGLSSCSNGIVWYRPGPGSDAAWAGWYAGSTPRNYPIDVKGTYTPVRTGGEAIVWWNPSGADSFWRWSHDQVKYVKGAYPFDMGPGLQPLIGQFNATGDRDDVFWYGPGSRPDVQVLMVSNSLP